MANEALRPHFIDDVVLAHVPVYLQAKIVVWAHFRRWGVIDFEGLDTLAKIGRVPADVDHIANAQRTRLEPQGRD